MQDQCQIRFEYKSVHYFATAHRYLGKPIHYVISYMHPENYYCARDFYWDLSKDDVPAFGAAFDSDMSLEAALAIRAAEKKRMFTAFQ